ncbi:unnamed protein product [Ostreobium quekettii]|uniref:Glyoxalase/fosfomycin resistance/dioxygenase domain-containing protein n=1 Tax=Ostreobium quekettii TaxID=121088 RepID=A0A8S1JD35_9CHLO|nr:unnamed protein product [Ostreobium quekettii]|eukprot:evm.model.scf_186.8 EVM.evm.TU.scf_186.8   scf_186:55772-56386(+)
MSEHQGAAPPKADRRPKGAVPYIVSPDCAAHIEWLKRALGAEAAGEVYHIPDDYEVAADWNKGGDPGKKPIVDAPVLINGGPVYMCDNVDHEKKTAIGEAGPQGRGFMVHLSVPDPDALWANVLKEGAKAKLDLKVQYWGAKFGVFEDPFGYQWSVSLDKE